MKKSHSVQATLQIAFFSILIIIFLVYISYFVITESIKIRRQAYNSIQQDVTTVSAFIESEVSALTTVMENIAYSNLIKDQFSTYLEQPITSEKGNYSGMQNSKILTDLLTAIMGPNRPVDQIYLYSLDYGVFGNGLDNSSSNESVHHFPWYNSLMESENNKIIFCSEDSRLAKYYSYKEGSRFLTLCSVYQSTFYKPQGIIEVKRSLSSLSEKLKSIQSKNYQEQISIFDAEGTPVYSTSVLDNSAYLNIIWPLLNDYPPDTVHMISHDHTKLFFSQSASTGFITLITISDKDLYRPIYTYVKANMVFFFIILLLTLILSYVVSKIITTPLMKMYAQLQALHTEEDVLSTDKTIKPIDTSLLELDTLYRALIDMHNRAQTSMKREIAMHNQEIQAHMLALQSQMNPHFLYNSLATIQAMADEGMKEEVIEMCQTISRILRYISSDKEPLVSIRQDIAHAKDYLECMKLRYEEDLEYEIDLPEEMMQLQIPKLCLQLIIENSIKFSTKSVRPPWHIKVKGLVTNLYWEISIQDNGKGFSQEDIDNLNKKIKYINETELLPSLEINGMGLMNIYLRFKTLYKGKHIFRISNLATGGAIVTIGGEFSPEDLSDKE